jgi:uncharacterized membrane protein
VATPSPDQTSFRLRDSGTASEPATIAELKERGHITEEEYNKAKASIPA